jgi:hypothetical protein
VEPLSTVQLDDRLKQQGGSISGASVLVAWCRVQMSAPRNSTASHRNYSTTPCFPYIASKWNCRVLGLFVRLGFDRTVITRWGMLPFSCHNIFKTCSPGSSTSKPTQPTLCLCSQFLVSWHFLSCTFAHFLNNATPICLTPV